MQYMLLIHDDPSAWAGMSEEQVNAVMGEYFAYSAAIREEGILVSGNPLKGREEARTVRVRDGKKVVADGPFAETKELIGGFALLEAASKEEAIRLGKEFMQIHVDILGQSYEGTLEVRPMFDPGGPDCS